MNPYRAAVRRQSRVDTGLRLRALYRSAGFSRAEAAQFLQVTERTLHKRLPECIDTSPPSPCPAA
ncbi:MAG: hypothetical protein Q4A98_08290 [Comamonadaceae bacterium]|nr:hypothetical protein [Comamonadaceae bacterium]